MGDLAQGAGRRAQSTGQRAKALANVSSKINLVIRLIVYTFVIYLNNTL